MERIAVVGIDLATSKPIAVVILNGDGTLQLATKVKLQNLISVLPIADEVWIGYEHLGRFRRGEMLRVIAGWLERGAKEHYKSLGVPLTLNLCRIYPQSWQRALGWRKGDTKKWSLREAEFRGFSTTDPDLSDAYLIATYLLDFVKLGIEPKRTKKVRVR